MYQTTHQAKQHLDGLNGTRPSNGSDTLESNQSSSRDLHNNNGNSSSSLSQDMSDSNEHQTGIKFQEWGFHIDRLFEVAYRFYKRNEKKAFHPSFDLRNQMNALILQVKHGNYADGKAPEVGVFDLIGKNRLHQWSLISGMSKTEAMTKFICTLDEICPTFKAYAEAVKICSDNSAGSRLYYNCGLDDNDGNRSESYNDDSSEQLAAVRISLNRQTYEQFKGYAEKQYPNDTPKQKYLIQQLQEQYYQQYVSQTRPDLNLASDLGSRHEPINEDPINQVNGIANLVDETTQVDSAQEEISNDQDDSLASSQQQQATAQSEPQLPLKAIQADLPYPRPPSPNLPRTSLPSLPPPPETFLPPPAEPATTPKFEAITIISNPQESLDASRVSPVQAMESSRPSQLDSNQTATKEDWGGASSTGAMSPLRQSFSYDPLEPANIWTKKGVNEFRDSLLEDKQSGSYHIPQSSSLVIQVPTYPSGKYIYFEFVTEDYDIGFGLEFVYEQNMPSEPLKIEMFEEDDEDDESDIGDECDELNDDDVEMRGRQSFKSKGELRQEWIEHKKAIKLERDSHTLSILPIYRRNSHEEVFSVRHKYPGQGYYRLKFDNTYSVLRSKMLHFRICYFI